MIYDPFQQKAIDYIKQGHSVIVSAPTGAGKTAIAEYVIMDCLKKGEKLIYTAPIKTLSNQKFRDFHETFPDKIGILTGDVSINPSAPILIMTTEIFRNKVLEEQSNVNDRSGNFLTCHPEDLERSERAEGSHEILQPFGPQDEPSGKNKKKNSPRAHINNYSWIIFDEVHYLDDYERGTVWEESLVFLPNHMKLLALSATIPNIDELASWLQSIHKKPLKIVKENKRPVPLHFFYQTQGEIVDNLQTLNTLAYKSQKAPKPNKPTSLIKHLFEQNKLPCIYFVFGRRRCEYLADEMMPFDFVNKEEKLQIISLYNKLCERFDLSNEKSALTLLPLIKKGIAYHHAGMLPTLKEVVERLFTSRLIKVIFTTETFALGINMPARTVIFDELRKFYGKFYASLKTRDFYQMAGRAGRRGIDKEGFVYVRVNPRWTSFQELHKIIYSPPEKVQSKFNASYATVLNLYEKYNENLYNIYPLSFHYFQSRTQSHKKALDLLYSRVKILKELGYIRKNLLTEKGKFASKIYGYELSLSELYEKGVLQNLSEIELGLLSAALVFEPRKGSALPRLNKSARSLCDITDNILGQLQKIEKRFNISPLSKTYYYHLSPCVEAWMKKENFDKLLHYTNEDEGEIIRHFRMSVQILREILDTGVSLEFKDKVKHAIYLINRDIIDAERQLRG